MPDQALEVAIETRTGGEGEADADRVALAQHLALDAQALAQAAAGAGGQHGQPRLHAAAAGQHDPLQARSGGDRPGPVLHELHALRPQPAHGVDQVVVAEANVAEAGEAGAGGDFQAVGHAQLFQQGHLRPHQLLAAEIRAIGRVGVDDRHFEPLAGQHQRQDRAAQARSHDGDIGHGGGRRCNGLSLIVRP